MKKVLIILIAISIGLTSCKKEKNTIKNKQKVEHIANTDFKSKIEGKNVQLIDVRTPGEYKDAHLENATLINYKDKNFVKNALAKLDKSKPVYVYCHSGHRSGNSAALLEKEGFKVYDMKGGISGWKQSGFKTVVTEEIDVQTKLEDKKEDHIIKKDKVEATIIKEVADKVTENTNVVKKIITETTTKVKEVAENTTEAVTIIKEEIVKPVETVTEVQNNSLTPAIIRTNTSDFKANINGKTVQLIDVRTPKEYKDSHIPNAKNINIYDNDFVQQASVLDKSKPVYVYCRSGVRSMKAASKLKNAGYKVYNLNGGIKGWEKAGNKTE